MFLLVNTGIGPHRHRTVVIAYAVIQNSLAGAQGAWFPELFNANTRSSGASMAYQFSAVVSGFTPFVVTLLYASWGWVGPARCSASTPHRPVRHPGHPGNLGQARTSARGRGRRRRRPCCPPSKPDPRQESR